MSRFLGKPLFRRLSWISLGLLLLILFGLFHLLGWREQTAILSGTSNSTDFYGSALRGVLYSLSYFSAVVVSPILILGAGIDAILQRMGWNRAARGVEGGRNSGKSSSQ